MSISQSPSVLVVDDHLDMAQLIAGKLESENWCARAVGSGRAAIDAIADRSHDLVITDLRMPDIDGFAVLEAARRNSAVIVMTAFGDISTAVEAMRRGAWHFVEKPVRMADIVDHARRALVRRDPAIVGASPPMQALARTVERVARSRAHVLIRGESGTGKELVARAIHEGGPRAGRPFITVNCAAIPDSLVESELFGHTRGAFTGATSHRRGLFAEADGGTLFLDEIGEMPLVVQAKLLRALQGGEVRAVGADDSRGVDARVIAATNQDLEARVKEGAFRADLYYRLSVVPLVVPPLRERGDDIQLLAAHLHPVSDDTAAAGLVPRVELLRPFDAGGGEVLTQHGCERVLVE